MHILCYRDNKKSSAILTNGQNYGFIVAVNCIGKNMS
jgi:hypothetical protein